MALPGSALWDGNLVEYQFFHSALAPSTTAAARRAPNGSANIPDYLIPARGWIVAVIAEIDAAAVSGTGSFKATINGTVTNVVALLKSGQLRNAALVANKRETQLREGDKLGVQSVTDGSWSGANPNVLIRVLVGYDAVAKIG